LAASLAAGPNASAAQDAPVVIHDEILPRPVDGDLGIGVLIDPVIHAVAVGQGLELAVAAHLAEHAVMIPLGEKHLEDELSFLDDFGRFCFDLHALCHGERQAGCGSAAFNPTKQMRQAPRRNSQVVAELGM
jgi:hypothetical protein